MKFIHLVLILFTNLIFSQNFEGTLIYTNDVEISEKFSKQFGLTKEKLIDTGKFFEETFTTYKNGNYMSTPNNGKVKTIYLSSRNEIITLDKKVDLISVIKAGVDMETKLKHKQPVIKVEETNETILNIECSKVIVEWETGTYEYYYNSDYLKMDSALYSNHRYDMWSEYLKISNALPLKIVKSVGEMMTISMTLKQIKEHPVNDKVFKLPKLKISEDFVITKGNQVYYERK